MSEETMEETFAKMGLDPSKLEEKKEEVKKEPEKPLTALERLKKFKGCPSDDEVQNWKKNYHEILTFSPGDEEMYVFRPLNRQEWKQLKVKLENVPNEDMVHETIVGRCVLWPALDSLSVAASRAGLAKTIYNLIMVGSYFLPDEIAMSMVEKL